MSGLSAYKIITAIICRADNHIEISERLERARKNRSRQMRAVAVESNHALLATCSCCEVRKQRGEACRKALALLRRHADRTVRHLRQCCHVRSRAHNRNFDTAQRVRQRYGVIQKAAIQLGDRGHWNSLR